LIPTIAMDAAYAQQSARLIAISIVDGKARINAKRCFGCGTCVLNCSEEALELKLVRPASHIPPEGGLPYVQMLFEVVPGGGA